MIVSAATAGSSGCPCASTSFCASNTTVDGTPQYGSGSPVEADGTSRGRIVSNRTPATSVDFVDTGVRRNPVITLL